MPPTASPIELYHCIDARSLRPLWTLEELQLPYTLHVLPFPPRALQKSYRSINPLGTVPLLVDGATRMTESAAICQYLAARHGDGALQVAPDEDGFGDYLNFLHFGEATLTFPQTLVLRYRWLETAERRQRQVAQDYEDWFVARLRSLEPRLKDSGWLCAGRFTAADISVGYALLLATYLDLSPRMSQVTLDYLARLQSRPAYQRAQQAQRDAALRLGVTEMPAPLTGR